MSESSSIPVRNDILAARRGAWAWISGPGSWWTGAQHIEMARLVRAARERRSDPPWLRANTANEGSSLPPAAAEVVQRVAIDAQRLDRAWSEAMIAELGDAAYVEAAAVASITIALDAFSEAMGSPLDPLPEPVAGAPDRKRAENVGDDGAWVAMTVPFTGPNVARALSLVPSAQMTFFGLVGSMYAMADFQTLVWKRPLSRPQVELVAARVSAVNECFY